MISETRRFAFSNVLMLVSLGMLVFTFTATHGTDCARAAGGSCAVGDTEVFGNDINVGGDLEFEGTSVDDFETKITATNPTADRTITLPDASGTLALAGGGAATVAEGGTGVTTLGANGVLVGDGTNAVNVTAVGSSGEVLPSNGAGSDPTFQAIPAPAGGLSMIDQWNLNVAPNGSQAPLNDWTKTDWDGAAHNIGAQMTESGGTFTFPSTGIYLIMFSYMYVTASSPADEQFECQLHTSLDAGVTWELAALANAGIFTSTAGQNCSVTWVYNVTDTTDRLLQLHIVNANAGTYGNGSATTGPSKGGLVIMKVAETS